MPDEPAVAHTTKDCPLCDGYYNWVDHHCYGCGVPFDIVNVTPTPDCICDPDGNEYLDWRLAFVLSKDGVDVKTREIGLNHLRDLDDVTFAAVDHVVSTEPRPSNWSGIVNSIPYLRMHIAKTIKYLTHDTDNPATAPEKTEESR